MDHSELLVTVSLINFTTLTDNGSTAGPSHTCILIVGDEDNNIVFKQKIVYVTIYSYCVYICMLQYIVTVYIYVCYNI